jgi:hypothetical protein
MLPSDLRLPPILGNLSQGTRQTDPHSEKLTFFDRTGGEWLDFVREHTVIDWRLEDV